MPVPCEEACPVKAISKDEYGVEHIDPEKCIYCGKCLNACPFGAIFDKCEVFDVLKDINNEKKVIAMVAPAVLAQFGKPIEQVYGALKALGFSDIVEVAYGAEETIRREAEELKEKIAMLLAGRAAEEIIFEDISGGASNDIERATKIAKNMVTRLGMSDVLGPRAFGNGQSEVFLGKDFSSSQDYSDATATAIDNEIHTLIMDAYNRAKQILTDNIDKLHFIAEFLVRNEIMDGEAARKIISEAIDHYVNCFCK